MHTAAVRLPKQCPDAGKVPAQLHPARLSSLQSMTAVNAGTGAILVGFALLMLWEHVLGGG